MAGFKAVDGGFDRPTGLLFIEQPGKVVDDGFRGTALGKSEAGCPGGRGFERNQTEVLDLGINYGFGEGVEPPKFGIIHQADKIDITLGQVFQFFLFRADADHRQG